MQRIAIAMLVLLASAPPVRAGKVKAELLCGVMKGKKTDFTLPTDDGRKLDKPIDCLIDFKGGVKSAPARIYTWLAGSGPMHAGTTSRSEIFEAILQPGPKLDGKTDYVPCSDDFEIVAEIGPEGSALWSQRIKVHQECAAAGAAASKSAASAAPAPGAHANVAEADLAALTDARARDAARRFADAAVAGDGAAAAKLCAGKGVRAGRKTVPCDAIARRGVAAAGFQPVCCEGGAACRFGDFGVTARSAAELWVTSTNGCVGAMVPVAVLRDKGGAWVWSEVRTEQNGE